MNDFGTNLYEYKEDLLKRVLMNYMSASKGSGKEM